ADLAIVRRSRTIERAIGKLTETKFEVKPSAQKSEVLDKAGVGYAAVESPHFVVFGDWEPAVLTEAAPWAERAPAFYTEAVAGFAPWPPKEPLTHKYAFLKQKTTWAEVVRKNASSIGNIDFVLQYTSSCEVGGGKEGLFLAGQEEVPLVQDYVVRMVAE